MQLRLGKQTEDFEERKEELVSEMQLADHFKILN